MKLGYNLTVQLRDSKCVVASGRFMLVASCLEVKCSSQCMDFSLASTFKYFPYNEKIKVKESCIRFIMTCVAIWRKQ